jgi:hypothetical protein
MTLGDTGVVLTLTPNPEFGSSLVLNRIAENQTHVIDHEPECYYTSSDGTHRAALHLCDGMVSSWTWDFYKKVVIIIIW